MTELNKDKLVSAIVQGMGPLLQGVFSREKPNVTVGELAEAALKALAKAVPYPTYSVEVVDALHHDRVLGNRAVGNEAELWAELKAMGEE